MKFNLLTIALLATAVISANTFASKSLTNDLHPPFIKRELPASGQLLINYDLTNRYERPAVNQKLVCIFEGFFGEITYVENNVEKDGMFPFMGQQMYFTNIGKTWKDAAHLDSVNQYHVDEKGYIKLGINQGKTESTTVSRSKPDEKGYATCFYQSETAK